MSSHIPLARNPRRSQAKAVRGWSANQKSRAPSPRLHAGENPRNSRLGYDRRGMRQRMTMQIIPAS